MCIRDSFYITAPAANILELVNPIYVRVHPWPNIVRSDGWMIVPWIVWVNITATRPQHVDQKMSWENKFERFLSFFYLSFYNHSCPWICRPVAAYDTIYSYVMANIKKLDKLGASCSLTTSSTGNDVIIGQLGGNLGFLLLPLPCLLCGFGDKDLSMTTSLFPR